MNALTSVTPVIERIVNRSIKTGPGLHKAGRHVSEQPCIVTPGQRVSWCSVI